MISLLTHSYTIAGYCRISVDEELDRDNVSIENQKSIIADYVRQHFPDSALTFYEDRDRSGYTFEQREHYQDMRRRRMAHEIDILIVKDFSRCPAEFPGVGGAGGSARRRRAHHFHW